MPNIIQELKKSEEYETSLFFQMARKLYEDSSTQCEDLYEIAMSLTDGFRRITPDIIVADSRIIKILRYCMLPVISQMKLGQLVELNSTEKFEEDKITKGKALVTLHRIAPEICSLFSKYKDAQRFLWLQTSLSDNEQSLAETYAKRWTCSLIANQNSSTAFRNWRKDLQESAAMANIIRAGYTKVEARKLITNVNDLLPGQCCGESLVKCTVNNNQKADLLIRLKKSKKLLLIEAKAIGVRLDAYKRAKECRNKYDQWKAAFGNQVLVGAVLSGFIPKSEYDTLVKDGALVFFEHDLNSLYQYVKDN